MGCCSSRHQRGPFGDYDDEVIRLLFTRQDPNADAIFDNLPDEYKEDVLSIKRQGMSGTTGAILQLADIHLRGVGQDKDALKGLALLNYLADLDNYNALMKLAFYYDKVEKNEQREWEQYVRILRFRRLCRSRVPLERFGPGIGAAQKWHELEGMDLEKSLQSDSTYLVDGLAQDTPAIRLLDAFWLVQHALESPDNRITYRQNLPQEAFLTVNEIVSSTKVDEIDFSKQLRIICLSYIWLDHDHPDPHGWTLGILVSKLKEIIKTDLKNRHDHHWGVLWDFASLHQHPDPKQGIFREQWEEELFLKGIEALSVLYAHPYTTVYKVTAFPPDYPTGYSVAEDPQYRTHAVVPYIERGWPFTESCLAGLTKAQGRTMDISVERSSNDDDVASNASTNGEDSTIDVSGMDLAQTVQNMALDVLTEREKELYCDLFFKNVMHGRELEYMLQFASAGYKLAFILCLRAQDQLSPRKPPLPPSDFDHAISIRSFTNGEVDRPRVTRLYRSYFERHFGRITVLDYTSMRWSDDEVAQVAGIIQMGNTPLLEKLFLGGNFTKTKGCSALANAILFEKAPNLYELCLSDNLDVRDAGVACLAPAAVNLKSLGLGGVFCGIAGCQKLVDCIQEGPATKLQSLTFRDNPLLGDDGCTILAQVVANLQELDLSNCNIGDIGCDCIIRGFLSQEKGLNLRKLDLHANPITDEGCEHLIKLVWECVRILDELDLRETRITKDFTAQLEDIPFRGTKEDANPFSGLHV